MRGFGRDALVVFALLMAHACVSDAVLRFQGFGDWGMGNSQQAAVAAAMQRAAASRGDKFVLNVGDNSYISGHDAHGNRMGGFSSIHDPLWAKYFTDAYALQVPFYGVLGNHDYMGNASCQLQYHAVDARWTMPARNYTATFALGDGSGEEATFVFIDSNPFISAYYSNPENPQQGAQLATQHWQQQLAWLNDTLAAVKRPGPVLVVGHHPIVTSKAIPDSVTQDMSVIQPLLEAYNVTAYVCGHVHLLGFAEQAGIGYVVTGAGATGKTYSDNADAVSAMDSPPWTSGEAGFVAFDLNATALDINFLDTKGNTLLQRTVAVPLRS